VELFSKRKRSIAGCRLQGIDTEDSSSASAVKGKLTGNFGADHRKVKVAAQSLVGGW
jgi:hypothetical protein